jgi:hypothetical protein
MELDLNGASGVAVGVGLAVATLAPLLFLSKLAGFQFLAVMLGFVGAIYFGFAVADGSVRSLLVEVPVSTVFLLAGAIALWADSPAVLAGGYAAHALWDLGHHPRAVTTPVRRWYPPFCVAYDLIVAAFVLAWLPLGGVA